MARHSEIITVTDLGQLAGCSIATVSRVLNNSGAVSAKKRAAVLKAIQDTDFHINRPRKGGRRTGAKEKIGNVVEIVQHRHTPIEPLSLQFGELTVGPLSRPFSEQKSSRSFGMDHSFYRGIVDGAIDELAQWGCRAQIRSNQNLLDQKFLADLNGPDRSGVLLIGEHSRDLVAFVNNCTHPLVLVDIMGVGQEDVLTTDNFDGITQAFNHLYELGHRRIGFVGALRQGLGRYDERYAAYKLNMVERGLALRQDWVYSGDEHISEVAIGVAEILKRSDRPSALLCQNDCCALGAVRAASRIGVSIPRELSIVGFDDVDSASLITPALTTVRVPVQEMGRRAVCELMMKMKRRTPAQPFGCRVRLVPQLIVRESTAAALVIQP